MSGLYNQIRLHFFISMVEVTEVLFLFELLKIDTVFLNDVLFILLPFYSFGFNIFLLLFDYCYRYGTPNYPAMLEAALALP
jgi:hypothetical protein